MSSWGSYPSIFAMGHRAISDLLKGPVNVEEKVDGSQFSFGLVESNRNSEGTIVDAVDYLDNDVNGGPDIPYSLKVRSKGAVIHIEAPPKMFSGACATVMDLFKQGLLHLDWTYRGEVLAKPKHNALAYDRTPAGGIIIFDINTGHEAYLNYADKAVEAKRLGLEVVPLLFSGVVDSIETFRTFLDTTSVLGGQKIEGVVVKPTGYDLYGQDKKVLFGKFVSEAFKEVHRKSWGDGGDNHKSGKKDLVEKMIATLATPARYQKALIHLREQGLITDTLRDIGTIIKEVPGDVYNEERGWIMETLFNALWPEISRGIIRGVPTWYKDFLLSKSFEQESSDVQLQQPTKDDVFS